ncbi:MAG: type I DNA topoisomerase [Candidatus Pacebacteria bacterium]|nr:type I DNA topoisomerase [Candidatus Paceibacterota bacterium]
MKLIIVESPTKAKTISGFLGKKYKVESSFGHIRDLPKNRLGIDIENNFEPHYVIPVKAKKNFANLKKIAKKADSIILATDEDREGEAISWHLAQALNISPENTKRIAFHEITKNAIENALEHPRSIDLNMVHSQQARRILDRLVGYKLSPFLWKKIAKGLSAGRVQSVALRIIMDREIEIKNFKPQKYWTLDAIFKKNDSEAPIEASLSKIDGKSIDKFDIKSREESENLKTKIQNSKYKVSSIVKKDSIKSPGAPFTTSTLQQESAKKLGYSSKKTMFMAQRLYEKGLITYMRTDSVNISKEAIDKANSWINSNLGVDYAVPGGRVFKGKSKLAQEAHEAIRPTNPESMPEKLSLEEKGEFKVYDLIWRRFLASQMKEAKIESIHVSIDSLDKEIFTFKTSGQRIAFDGFLKIWPNKFEEKELPKLEEKESLNLKEILSNEHETEPPGRYGEASLIKTLEDHGIGRPSTYSPIISVIQARNYVVKESGKFKPTEVGEIVDKTLRENFPEIIDINFTADLENKFDDIAEGKEVWQESIKKFYVPFEKNLEIKYKEVLNKEAMEEKTDEKCEKCQKPMIIKMGRFGKFLACTGFPECKNTKKIDGATGGFQKEPPKSTGIKCTECGAGELLERRVSKGRARGKVFWGCSNYPKCKHATWDNPTGEKPEEKDTKEVSDSKEEKDSE